MASTRFAIVGVLSVALCPLALGDARSQSGPDSAGNGQSRKIRLIAPDQVAPAPSDGPLERLPAQTDPAAGAKNTPRLLTVRSRLLHRPIIVDGGTFVSLGYRVAIEGVAPLPLEYVCTSVGGIVWPCGMAARTAFRYHVRGRSLRCRVPDEPPDNDAFITSLCTLAGEDIGNWLVSQGWAQAAGDAYRKESETARLQKRGIFGAPPAPYPANLPSINAQVSGTP